MRRLQHLCLIVSLMLLCCAGHAEETLIDIQSTGSGLTREEAMKNAVEEALRQSMGTMILSREELTDDSLIDKVIQVSRGSVKASEVLSETAEGGKITLTARFRIDPREIQESARNAGASSGGRADIIRRPLLEHGRQVIRAFFEGLDLLEFLDVKLKELRIDPDKEEFYALVRLLMNTEKYTRLFSGPLTAILDEALPESLDKELAGEAPESRYAGIIYVLGTGRSFRAWALPKAFVDELRESGGFDGFEGRNILQTQKRIWVNISLIDGLGRELQYQRIPVLIPITNIILFSSGGSGVSSPWGVLGSYQPQLSIICAPLFGMRDNSGRRYNAFFADEADPFEQKFVFRLPKEVLSRVKNAVSWLQIEK
ncbi:MAG: hypothetical protein II954_10490 [Synergistaceae bacterium]|nr:hypothetical protein [Synergistaceae bacterium]